MDHSIAIPALVAFFITLILGPGLISFLHKLKFGQFIREEGPESHLKKSGTPTMGGILFLVGILVGSAFYIPDYKKIIPILFVTLGFGLIGFLDDYIKVVMKRNLGLTPAQKMLGQIVITAVFAFYMVNHSGLGTDVIIPFSGGKEWHLGILYIPILFVVVLGTVNGANFTDGLDGLAASVTTLIAVFLTVIAVGTNAGIHPVICAVIGALLGFLCFNTHPAKVFMGDTGSLTLGFLIAFFGLKFYNLNINTDMFGIQATPAVFLGIVFIPAFDTLRVFCVRIASGLSPFYPDKRHIHHKMLRLGLTHFQSAMLIIVMQTCFILMNVLMKNVNINLLFGIDLLLGVLLVWQLDRMGDRRERKGKA